MSFEYTVKADLKTKPPPETIEPKKGDEERAAILAYIKAENDNGKKPAVYDITSFLDGIDPEKDGREAYHNSRKFMVYIQRHIRRLKDEGFLDRDKEKRTRPMTILGKSTEATREYVVYSITKLGERLLDYVKQKNIKIRPLEELYEIKL